MSMVTSTRLARWDLCTELLLNWNDNFAAIFEAKNNIDVQW